MSKEELLQAISDMTVLELADLVKALEETFGVSADIISTARIMSNIRDIEKTQIVEQMEFDVILSVIGDQKIQVIKAVRELTNLGLRESKTIVDQAPSEVLKDVNMVVAATAKEKLTSAGATVEIR